MATPPSQARASSRRPSTCRVWRRIRPAAPCTSSPTTSSASRRCPTMDDRRSVRKRPGQRLRDPDRARQRGRSDRVPGRRPARPPPTGPASGKDLLLDLVGYRRWGHNEGDEPSFTQPRLYSRVRPSPDRARAVRKRARASAACCGAGEPEAFLKAGLDEFQRHPRAVARSDHGPRRCPAEPDGAHRAPAVAPIGAPSLGRLRELNTALLHVSVRLQLNAKLGRAVQRRRTAFDADEAVIDWGQAESLALATLVTDGITVRLTGQDSVRGTFSQRHVTFYDGETGRAFTPLAALADRRRRSTLPTARSRRTPRSASSTATASRRPTRWCSGKAQYGDFINGAQVIVDEFVVSGQAKWGLRSGLVLLLPHAWEGQGPDHSSGRLERFLELAAEDNLRIACRSTAAQYFSLLRRQAACLRREPQTTDRHHPQEPAASATRARHGRRTWSHGELQMLLDDERAAAAPERVRRVVLCSGKIWADLTGRPASGGRFRPGGRPGRRAVPVPGRTTALEYWRGTPPPRGSSGSRRSR